MAKRYKKSFQFFDTEDKVKAFCDRQNKANPYLRRNKPAHYTPWTSKDGSEQKYIAWFYK